MKILDTLYPVSKETTTTQKILGSTITHDLSFALFGLVTALGVALAAYYGLHVPNPYMAVPFGVIGGALTLLVAKILDTLVYQLRERQLLANKQSAVSTPLPKQDPILSPKQESSSAPQSSNVQPPLPSLQEREISYKGTDGVLFTTQPVDYQAGASTAILNSLYSSELDLPKPRILWSGRPQDEKLVAEQIKILQMDEQNFAAITVQQFLSYHPVVKNAVIERLHYYEVSAPNSIGQPLRSNQNVSLEKMSLAHLRSFDVNSKTHRTILEGLLDKHPAVASLFTVAQAHEYMALPIGLPGEIVSTTYKLSNFTQKDRIAKAFELHDYEENAIDAYFTAKRDSSGFQQAQEEYLNTMMGILEEAMQGEGNEVEEGTI